MVRWALSGSSGQRLLVWSKERVREGGTFTLPARSYREGGRYVSCACGTVRVVGGEEEARGEEREKALSHRPTDRSVQRQQQLRLSRGNSGAADWQQ